MQIRSAFDSLNLAHLLHIPRRNEAKGDLKPDRANEKKASRSHVSRLRSALSLGVLHNCRYYQLVFTAAALS